MTDQMLQEKYNQLGEAHVMAMNQIEDLKERLKMSEEVIRVIAPSVEFGGICDDYLTKWGGK
jgi:hypothetical protein